MTAIDHRVFVTDPDMDAYVRTQGAAPMGMVVFFPGGCPPVAPPGWPEDVDYDGAHLSTVCPACADSWRLDHLVSDPVRVPDGTPLTMQVSWTAQRARVYAHR